MIVARCYSVMDRMVVEVSCVHNRDPLQSHLVIREERRGLPLSQVGALRALSDVCDLASLLTNASDEGSVQHQLGECKYDWANPSD